MSLKKNGVMARVSERPKSAALPYSTLQVASPVRECNPAVDAVCPGSECHPAVDAFCVLSILTVHLAITVPC